MRTCLLGMIQSFWVVVLTSMIFLAGEVRSKEQLKSISSITIGSRIRLSAPAVTKRRIEGTIIEMDVRSLLIGTEDRSTLSVPRQAITKLDVSLGKHRQVRKGILIGGGIGAIALALTLSSYITESSGWVTVLTGGFAGGAMWGAGIGALIKKDRWSAVPIELVQLGLAPTQGSCVRLSLSVDF